MEKNLKVIEHSKGDFYFLYLKKISEEGTTDHRWHEHTFYEIMYFSEGESEFVIENRRYKVKSGDVLLIKPGNHHFQRTMYDRENALYCIGFYPDKIESKALAEELFERGHHFYVGESSPLARLMSVASDKLEMSDHNAKVFVKSVCEAAISILYDTDMKRERSLHIKNENVDKVISFINSNLLSIKTTEDISGALFFSESYLRAIFKREMGIGVMEYVRNKKLLLADRKIRNGKKPTEVYSECGFLNYPSFYRAYTAYFGCSPKSRKP